MSDSGSPKYTLDEARPVILLELCRSRKEHEFAPLVNGQNPLEPIGLICRICETRWEVSDEGKQR